MSDFLNAIRHLIAVGEVRISEHGYDELAEDGLTVKELLDGIDEAQIVEEYPDYPKGRCILLLQNDTHGKPVHVLWGIPKGYDKPVVLVTSYRPDPKRWDQTFLQRIK
ncbi:MAG: DUF4258 domain-containing protein [Bacteroidetes bacterium]|nr:DUF4258 domain-containing protein [Bacteroidota bacterium]